MGQGALRGRRAGLRRRPYERLDTDGGGLPGGWGQCGSTRPAEGRWGGSPRTGARIDGCAEDGRVSDADPTKKDWTRTAGVCLRAGGCVVRHAPPKDAGAARHERGVSRSDGEPAIQ